MGSGAGNSSLCRDVLNLVLENATIRWQEWDLPQDYFDKLNYTALFNLETSLPYYLSDVVPEPDEVCMPSDLSTLSNSFVLCI